jgi:hypothetical protein
VGDQVDDDLEALGLTMPAGSDAAAGGQVVDGGEVDALS